MAVLVRQLLRPLADQGLAPLDGTVARTGDAVAEPLGVSLAAHLGGLVVGAVAALAMVVLPRRVPARSSPASSSAS